MTTTPTPQFNPGDWPRGLPDPVSAQLLKGGWVAATWRVRLSDGRDVVAKVCPYPAQGEVDGFGALRSAGVPVPEVLGVAGGTLVMEFVSGPPDWHGLGSAVAQMHRCTNDRYGWHQDNRMGRFVQPNGWLDDWPTFFVERRVRPHLADPVLPAALRLRLERACDGPVQSLLPARPYPSLTHGDLWMGNIVDGRWIIDPEVSYADRELDLVNMLGSVLHPLPQEFWRGYQEVWPIPEDLDLRKRALGLHHRLLGVRHFGEALLPALAEDLTALGC